MKIIGDIRIYKSRIENIEGNSLPFDYETENSIVEQKIEQAMKDFDYSATPYTLDFTPGRFFYFYHDCKRGWKYVRPVVKKL